MTTSVQVGGARYRYTALRVALVLLQSQSHIFCVVRRTSVVDVVRSIARRDRHTSKQRRVPLSKRLYCATPLHRMDSTKRDPSSNLAVTATRPLLSTPDQPKARDNDYASTAPSTTGSSSTSPPQQEDDVLPSNVSERNQLKDLPEECLSGDPIRPLQHFDEDGKVCTYALNPMVYSVFVILLMEGIERFAFYGINYTQTSYLTGSYDRDWNAGMEAIPASSVRCLVASQRNLRSQELSGLAIGMQERLSF
jgi:hypothetical protein